MKIISKRGKKVVPPTTSGVSYTTSVEHSIIITGSGYMTPEEIKAAEEIFKEIRRQLEEYGGIITP